jgi:hypothetical protein
MGAAAMRLPIRNKTSAPLVLFMEPLCFQYEIPPGGEAIVNLEDGKPHSIDVHDDHWLSLWDEGLNGTVEIFSSHQSLRHP